MQRFWFQTGISIYVLFKLVQNEEVRFTEAAEVYPGHNYPMNNPVCVSKIKQPLPDIQSSITDTTEPEQHATAFKKR